MNVVTRLVVALAVAGAATGIGYAVHDMRDAGAANASSVLGPGLVDVTIDIHHSAFSISSLRVRAGSVVRFTIRNTDPIEHEFIVGPQSVHDAHERGTEAVHPPIPGEVSIDPLDVGETFYRFDQPGRVLFACHLPGHFKYGMHGWITVT
ncbi:MAG TPA: plastocyanin/azurin family copper-binding protein [Acidimicrobiia bacterium]|nr:plastocyanin/azurin family copper-binding protein [Acidimicrobiia bacterium]